MTDAPDLEAMLGNGGFGDGHQAPLDADHIPNENQSHTCFSCHEPIGALYCGNCGQKNDDFRRPLWQLGREAIASLTAIENKIWRTWAVLVFKPGKVAREFADGRRTHWSSPVRIYIFMSIVLFFFMETTGTLFFALEGKLTPKNGIDKPASELTVKDVHWSVSPHLFPSQKMVEQWNADLDFELFNAVLSDSRDGLQEVFADFRDSDYVDASEVLDALNDGTAEPTAENLAALDKAIAGLHDTLEDDGTGVIRIALRDTLENLESEREIFAARVSTAAQADSAPAMDDSSTSTSSIAADMPDDPIPQTSEMDTTLPKGSPDSRGVIVQEGPLAYDIDLGGGTSGNVFLNDMIENPAIVNNALNRWLPRIVFLMMPLTMLISALFIRGLPRRARKRGCPRGERQALLFDHLVHATYIHAVAYALLFVGIIATRVFPSSGGTIAGSLVLAMLVYLPISLRRMFRRGWFKTLWTSYGVAFIHFLFVNVFVSIAIANALQDHFAK